ncbi:hypothetical protein [Streptomyces spectabilis]|uniref:Uncharacterized protein n=1 Tax=Streptomyces spectabilis TaxID=68270 RepID=A0A7W8ETK9_STRST|nr:hypothetical protein [Streptomyces spectabilis]MBB5103273.1 hypothetical protein [Streptomyces spectabilis]MCI3902464.1 hypothetical protein [Streptomyces spectabilis]GGV13707.1 hypothetical protein GCM10010245_23910 [Streptomyces spectabilis]
MPDPQHAVDAAKVTAQAINDYGPDSPEALGAMESALDAVRQARAAGYTDEEIRRG